MTGLLSNLVQLSMVLLAISLVAVGEWPIAVAAIAGALALLYFDRTTERAYRRAERVGYSMRRNRAGDGLMQIVFACAILGAAWFFFGKALGW